MNRDERERAMRARWARRRRRLQAYGTWQPFVDPEPVRAHVKALRDFGLSLEAIALMAGEHPSALSTLMQPRNSAYLARIRQERADAYLGLRFDLDAIPDAHRVSSVGTVRRISALMAIGHPLSEISNRIGVTMQAVAQYRTRPHVAASTARRIRDVYDDLWDKPGTSIRSVKWAHRNGWPPPLAWDDDQIDDPAAIPDLGSDIPTGQALAENVAELLDLEPLATAARIAPRLGYDRPDSLQRALARAGHRDLLAQLARNATLAPTNRRTA